MRKVLRVQKSFFLTWPATTFSLLLLDVALPGASGLEIAQRVRAQNSKVGIIMLTALDANADQVQGLKHRSGYLFIQTQFIRCD
jgi:DNA-binding response OmpR family regulator